MKNYTFKTFLILLSLSFSAYAQNEIRSAINTDNIIRCGADEYNARLLQQNPDMMGSEVFEKKLARKIAEQKANSNNKSAMVVVTIPVVIHILHNGEPIGTGQNISDAQAISQITVLNEDYRRMMGTPGFNTNPDGADLEVEFCLAQTDPNGNPTTGIHRVNIGQNGITETSPADAQNQMDALKPSSIWPAADYMNMWSIAFNGGQGLLGYAQFPGGPANTDGVVADYRYFGSSDYGAFPLGAPFDKGRTMTHEVGHFLGLFHTFQGGCGATGSTAGDFCADTPTVASGNSNTSVCNTGNDSCPGDPGLDMVENYMDYSTDACMNTFTNDQKARVVGVLTSAANRASLTTSNVCNASTTPLINFSPGSTSPDQIAEGSDCNFQDFNIDMTITMGASANATASLVNAGTAVEGEDFMLINNSVVFPQGSTTPSNAVTLRIFNDNFVETDETISLSININTTGDAVASTALYNASILNDDEPVINTATATYYSDNFDDEDISDWTLTDSDLDGNGFGNQYTVGPVTNPALMSRSWLNAPLTPDNWAVTPAFDLSSASGTITMSWTTQVAAASWDEEKYSVHVGTTNNIATLVGSTTSLTDILGDADNTGAVVNHTLDISAFAGQANVYIAFRHWDCTDQDYLAIDNLTVTGDVSVEVQTDVNTATPDEIYLNAAGLVYSTDVTTNSIMADIDNTSGFDYGCTTVAVSRDLATAGAEAISYNGGTDASGFVAAKTFDITTTNANTSGDTVNINFYFTEAEIAAWEAATGNNRSTLYTKNESTDEVVPVTISAFGTELKLAATLSNGLAGTYVFGTQLAFLSVNDFELAQGLSIYPNPTSDILNIDVKDGNDIPDTYKVYNMLGQLVIENKINSVEDLSINTTSYSNGVYFIKIAKDSRAVTLPFIKK